MPEDVRWLPDEGVTIFAAEPDATPFEPELAPTDGCKDGPGALEVNFPDEELWNDEMDCMAA